MIMAILNFTQHAATAEQVAAGVIDLMQHDLASLKALRHKPRTAYLISRVDALNSELKAAEMAVTMLKRGF